jgi:hypothetical protein
LRITSSIGGAILATSEDVGAAGIPGGIGWIWIRFHFMGGVSLSASTTYYLELYRTGSRDDSNYVKWREINSGNLYADGMRYYKSSGVWDSTAGMDFTFRIKTALTMPATAKEIDAYIVTA